jgi:hypothetical protein
MSASPQRPKADLREKVLRGISRGLAARHVRNGDVLGAAFGEQGLRLKLIARVSGTL